jgi:CAAX prenyl protease-like protein
MTDAAPAQLAPDQRDSAYLAPMLSFLLLTWAGTTWPSLYAASYVAKTIIAGSLLFIMRRHYAKVNWNYWWLGAILGVVGIVQWVGMEKLLLHGFPSFPEMHAEVFVPREAIRSKIALAAFIAFRWGGPTLVVPFMEEFFWRDFLWRSIAAPANFRIARIGEWERGIPLLIVSIAFSAVHIQWFTALVWGVMIGGLLIYTRSLGACIVMHAVTNFLLGAYVLWTGDWMFW